MKIPDSRVQLIPLPAFHCLWLAALASHRELGELSRANDTPAPFVSPTRRARVADSFLVTIDMAAKHQVSPLCHSPSTQLASSQSLIPVLPCCYFITIFVIMQVM